ncbi:dihydrofolate reductase [Alteromonadaceae bacterium M269]|nr:dihydrofolate reductase [Alteromonadaceae bacterium M269]
MANTVFIATSLDGFIADKDDGIDWLHSMPNPTNSDMGFALYMSNIDAIIMGRNTFELVLSIDVDWPYIKPVFVLSHSLKTVPTELKEKVFLINGAPEDVLKIIHEKGFKNLYIDGGVTIQNFLKEDLIDSMIITTIPILLGQGIPLFSELKAPLKFSCIKSEHIIQGVVQSHFVRNRNG